MQYECTSNFFPTYFELFRIFFHNQPECFEHVENILDGLPNQPERSTNVTNALRISPNYALRIMIRTTFGLIRPQCDWGIYDVSDGRHNYDVIIILNLDSKIESLSMRREAKLT